MPILHNWKCKQKRPNINSNKEGFRKVFFYPINNGKYVGEFDKNLRNGYGVKFQKNSLIYDGNFKEGLRNSHGNVYKNNPNGQTQTIYVGNFEKSKKNGEGKRFYNNGVYYGFWKNNKRAGLGIMWFDNGSIYMGEWANDCYNGTGVLFQENKNSYEGFWKNGLKHGEGTFYHNQTGQVQKGIWLYDICKTSVMQDEFRNSVISPTKYPIPQNKLQHPNNVVYETFQNFIKLAEKDC